jgi:DNA adenine methylase
MQGSNDSDRSFLRWAGSKRKLLSVLTEHLPPEFNQYIEPFAGSACVFFRLRPRKAVLGDINTDLIETFREVKYRCAAVAAQLHKLKKSKRIFLQLRSLEPQTLSASARAARFIYLNRCCFNGIYRTNLKGKFNVPYGGDRSGELPSATSLRSCSKSLKAAELNNGDFETTSWRARPGDFVYLDPPFSVKARRVFKEYGANIFGQHQLTRLRAWLERLADSRIRFLVSYAESKRVRRLVGPVYEQVTRGQWREAFKKATQVLEERCRRYLKAEARSPNPRIIVIGKKGLPRQLSASKINRLSLGQLADAFAAIQKPNQTDTLVSQVLATINPDRVNLTHFEGDAKKERKLRANVGQHMWRILAALKAICK